MAFIEIRRTVRSSGADTIVSAPDIPTGQLSRNAQLDAVFPSSPPEIPLPALGSVTDGGQRTQGRWAKGTDMTLLNPLLSSWRSLEAYPVKLLSGVQAPMWPGCILPTHSPTHGAPIVPWPARGPVPVPRTRSYRISVLRMVTRTCNPGHWQSLGPRGPPRSLGHLVTCSHSVPGVPLGH